jgi:hypothetical protein
MNNSIKASLIITYRQREAHLRTQLSWWQHGSNHELFQWFEVFLIEVSEAPSGWVQDLLSPMPWFYHHCPCGGVFHKTRALNLGLGMASGEFVVPYDVDLLPTGNSLANHLWIAMRSPDLLITGYRLMGEQTTVVIAEIPTALDQSHIAPEDQPSALWKHLVRHEKFGVLPFFRRDRLHEIGGWDEQFVGWGGEDQDVIERYLNAGHHLCRCPELVYLHLFHDSNPDWSDPDIIAQNRQHYYSKSPRAKIT